MVLRIWNTRTLRRLVAAVGIALCVIAAPCGVARADEGEQAALEAQAQDGVSWREWDGCLWMVDADGNLTVRPADGETGTISLDAGEAAPWDECRERIVSVRVEPGVKAQGSIDGLFSGCTALVEADLSGLDVTGATSMEGVFEGCTALSEVPSLVDGAPGDAATQQDVEGTPDEGGAGASDEVPVTSDEAEAAGDEEGQPKALGAEAAEEDDGESGLDAAATSVSVSYRTHVQNVGWQGWQRDGGTSGTSGKSLRLEAIQVRLTGDLGKRYDVYYRVHAQNFGWLGWARNGEAAGTSALSYRLEAIQVTLVPKGAAAPGSTESPYLSFHVQTHVQNVGWQEWRGRGETSGTSGRGLRLEGVRIELGDQFELAGIAGDVRYRTHVQDVGWQGWTGSGEMSGTSGRALRLEAIQIELTGELAQRFDIYYRVHAQNFGWMGWAKNGAKAGTEACAYRLEAIQIVIVPKGGAAPGSTTGAFLQGRTHSSVLEIAKRELGYTEAGDPLTGTKYGRWFAQKMGASWYGGNGVPWCAMFVSWVLDQAKVSCRAFPNAVAIDKTDPLGNRMVLARDLKPGDIVGFDWDGDGLGDHVGIVESVTATKVNTIEGNTGKGEVARRSRPFSEVTCGVRPYYSDVAAPSTK